MKLSTLQKAITLLLIALSLSACGDSEKNTLEILENPPLTIEQYITDNHLQNVIKTEEGMYIQIEKEGSIEKPIVSNDVIIHYKGYLLDHTVFDQTDGDAATFPLSALITGWKIGIPYLGRGGKCKLIIPPHLGYGSMATGDIPANSVLVFDIELEDFK